MKWLTVIFASVKFLLVIFIFLVVSSVSAQDSLHMDSIRVLKDSLAITDSTQIKAPDSLITNPIPIDSIQLILQFPISSDSARFTGHTYLQFTNPIRYTVKEKIWKGKEEIFYSVLTLLILFALIKNNYRRYVGDLYRIFFRTSVRQKQIKEQLLQNPLPSILLNIFFTISTGLFLTLIFQHYQFIRSYNFWLTAFYIIITLGAIYTIKFMSLKLLGWVFQTAEAASTYIFIIFTTNKIIGITLLPFLVLLAFTNGVFYEGAVVLSLIVVFTLILYRYFLSFISVRRTMKINFLHLFIYFVAFEIFPLLLINKLLFMFLEEFL